MYVLSFCSNPMSMVESHFSNSRILEVTNSICRLRSGLRTVGRTAVGFAVGRPYDPFLKINFFNFFFLLIFDSWFSNSFS